MEHGVLVPVLFKAVDGESLEQVSPAQEIVFQGREQQALAEPAGTAQEVDMSFVGEFIHQLRLIDIDISILDNLLEILYSNRVLHTLDCCFTWQIYEVFPRWQRFY